MVIIKFYIDLMPSEKQQLLHDIECMCSYINILKTEYFLHFITDAFRAKINLLINTVLINTVFPKTFCCCAVKMLLSCKLLYHGCMKYSVTSNSGLFDICCFEKHIFLACC